LIPIYAFVPCPPVLPSHSTVCPVTLTLRLLRASTTSLKIPKGLKPIGVIGGGKGYFIAILVAL
jgi:hypothetical protein